MKDGEHKEIGLKMRSNIVEAVTREYEKGNYFLDAMMHLDSPFKIAQAFYISTPSLGDAYVHHTLDIAVKVRRLYRDDKALRLLCEIAELHAIYKTRCSSPMLAKYLRAHPDLEEILCGIDAITQRKDEAPQCYLKRCMGNAYAHKVKIVEVICSLEKAIKESEPVRVDECAKQLATLCGYGVAFKVMPAVKPYSQRG